MPCLATVGEGPAAVPTRLPAGTTAAGLNYHCLALPSGQHVLLGRTGLVGAPTVLLVHGLGQNAHRDWAHTLPALAAQFQVLTVDLPGFGASPPPGRAYDFAGLDSVLSQVLDATVPGQAVHVVGHSLGGALSLHFAHRHPERVQRLVLVDAAGILLKPVFVMALARQNLPRVGLGPLDRFLGFVEDRVNGLNSLLLLGRDDRYDFLPWLMRHPEVRQPLLGGLVQVDAALGLVEHDFSAALRETQAPTTVLWGALDRIAPLRTGQVLAQRLPRARLQVLAAADHTPMVTQPVEFNRLLMAALGDSNRVPVTPTTATTAAAVGPSQGHVVCRRQADLRYSGRFDSLTLDDCRRVVVEDAQLGGLTVLNSTVSLQRSVVNAVGEGPALTAQDSEVVATASRFQGRVAISTDNSFFDLAGVSLRAREQAVWMKGRASRLFLSVSDWQGSDFSGDAHFIWPRPGDTR